jgi:E3 ubiquitin-protein ligase UBR7
MCPPSSSSSTAKRRCTLYPAEQQPQPPNEGNASRYTHNFSGEFCRCGRDYDPETEAEAMIHCIGCEVSPQAQRAAVSYQSRDGS